MKTIQSVFAPAFFALAIYPVGWIKSLWGLGAVYFFSAQMIVLAMIGIYFLSKSLRGKECRN